MLSEQSSPWTPMCCNEFSSDWPVRTFYNGLCGIILEEVEWQKSPASKAGLLIEFEKGEIDVWNDQVTHCTFIVDHCIIQSGTLRHVFIDNSTHIVS